MKVDIDSLIRSTCKESFYEFVKEFWDTIIADEPVWNWHIKYICDEIQKVCETMLAGKRKEYDLLINVSPGSTKSTIASVMLTPWLWTRRPSIKMLNGSFTQDLSLDLSQKSRRVVQSEKYQRVFGINLRDDQNAKSYWENEDGGNRRSASTGADVIGKHADIIVVDDPLNPKGAASEKIIKEAKTWLDSSLFTRVTKRGVTPFIMIMQRLHQEDPSGIWIQRDKDRTGKGNKSRLKHICIPAEITDDVKPRHLRRKYKNGLMDPNRLPKDVLEDERMVGEFHYASQFLQSPVPLTGGMFKVGQIELFDEAPNINHCELLRYWDKAGTEDDGAYSAGVLMARHKPSGCFWILDVQRGQWAAEEREARIKQTAQTDPDHTRIMLEQEPGSGGKESAQNTVKNLAGWNVKSELPTGDKRTRAYPFAAQTNVGNVKCLNRPWTKAYLEELQYFPNSTYKDQVDGSSGAFNNLHAKKKKKGGVIFSGI